MTPRIVAIAGPHRGSTFPLTGDQMTIGRHASNWICLTDRSASRKHCLVSKNGQEFKLQDLESRNGTFVNDIPIQERSLQHGDKIGVGDSSFLFLLEEDKYASSPTQFSELGILTTTRLRMEDSLYLQPEKILPSAVVTRRTTQGLEAVLRFIQSIQLIHDVEALHIKLLESVFEMIPAGRGSIILLEDNSTEILSVYSYDRNLKKLEAPVSRTVVALVARERSALLSNDIIEESTLQATESIVKSLIAIPLAWMDHVLGVLYIDTLDANNRFDEDHLQLASAFAAYAAVAMGNLRYVETLLQDQQRLVEDLRIEHNMIGESSSLKEVVGVIAKVARTDATVLIYGESGTGKELAARALHLNSPRSSKPFITINCANLSEALLESELFGHEKGAFTGAHQQKKGKLEMADGGTVFLDEIAELAPALQSRILHVLQEREFERVGGTRSIKVDIRLIAATNKNLEEAIRAGRFRQDLYYRLNVIQIDMPPLRERREDIPLLVSYFAFKYGKKCAQRIIGISPEARRCLTNYDWPGNVRQLQNVIERAVVLGTEDVIRIEDLPEEVVESSSAPVTKYQDLLRQSKRKLILEALDKAKGDHAEAAQMLGIHSSNLHRMVRTLNLKSEF